MRLDQLTVKAAEALKDAQERVSAAGHSQLEPLHLLLSLIDQKSHNGGGIVSAILEKMGIQIDRLRQIADEVPGSGPKVDCCHS